MAIVLDGNLGLTSPAAVLTTTPLAVTSGGTGVTTSTGTGAVVRGTSPTITGATITVAATAAPAFSAYQSTLQSLTSATFTKLSLQTEEFDTNSNYDNATNYRFTPTVAGYYQINSSVGVVSSSAIFLVSVYKNGVELKRGVQYGGAAGSGNQAVVSALVYLNGTTDYVESYGYQGSGGAINSAAVLYATYFQAFLARSA
jgi:hypothetical protein